MAEQENGQLRILRLFLSRSAAGESNSTSRYLCRRLQPVIQAQEKYAAYLFHLQVVRKIKQHIQ